MYCDLRLRPQFEGATKGYFYDFDSFTGESARKTAGGGYTPRPVGSEFDGINYYVGNGRFGGEIQVFRRKIR